MTQEILTAMLLGHACGDAMGVPVESETRRKLENTPVTEMHGFGVHNQPPGTWSADTSLTVATMESMTRLKKIDLEDIMRNFVDWYSGDKFTANDYTFDFDPITAEAIKNFLKGYRAQDCGISDEYANENGALIRMLPVAAYIYLTRGNNFDNDAMKIVHEITALTHAHPRTLIACGIYCLIAAEIFDGQNLQVAFSNGVDKAKNFYSTQENFQGEWFHYEFLTDKNFAATPAKNIVSRVYVIDNLKAALWCLLNTDNYKDLILKAVNLGGDTDTVAAIAGGLAGAFYGVEQIPQSWLDVLKKKDYLQKISADFYNAFGREKI